MPTARGRSRRRWPAPTARRTRSRPPPAHATDGVDVCDRHPRRPCISDRDGRRLYAPRDRGRPRSAALIVRPRSRCRSSASRRGSRAPARLVGAILARDLTISGTALVEGPAAQRGRPRRARRGRGRRPGDASSCRNPGSSTRTTRRSVSRRPSAGPGLTIRGPIQSRVDLLAEAAGVLNVRIAELERLNRIDPLEVFTAFDGQVVEQGDLVASVKVAPHLVDAATVDAGARLADFGSHPLVWVAPFLPSGSGSSSRSRSARRRAPSSRPASGPRSRVSARRSSPSTTWTTTPRRSRPRWRPSSGGPTRST